MNTQAAQLADRLARIDHDEQLRIAAAERRSTTGNASTTQRRVRRRRAGVLAAGLGAILALFGSAIAEAWEDDPSIAPSAEVHQSTFALHERVHCGHEHSAELVMGRFLRAV